MVIFETRYKENKEKKIQNGIQRQYETWRKQK